MTKVEGNPTYIKKGLLSSDRLVFAVVCATIIVETGIIRVSGFEAVHDVSADVKIFIGLGIFCVFSQLIILNFVRNKVGKSFLSRNHVRLGVINKAMLMVQLGIIVLLIVVLLEVSLTFRYHAILIKAVIIGSFLTASALTSILSWRWIKSKLIIGVLPGSDVNNCAISSTWTIIGIIFGLSSYLILIGTLFVCRIYFPRL
jgi:hypothetical protein